MDPAATDRLKQTPLYAEHVAAGARIVDYAGWEMPVQYEGVRVEHEAVRTGCGVFDVSHMGEILTVGPGALDFLQRLLSNDVSRLTVGGAQYSLLCREDGGVLDDVFTYRLDDEVYLTVTNAANHERDFTWFAEHASGFDAEVHDVAADYAMLAVQGPGARELLSNSGVLAYDLPGRMKTAVLPLRIELGDADREVLVCGTGYTGEDGVELLLPPRTAAEAWRKLLAAGAVPAGLAARDTLRLEVCFHLYGNDLSLDTNPIEAGLGWACKEETGFIGAEAVAAARERDAGADEASVRRLVAFRLTEAGVPRAGNAVLNPADGEAVGVVTSGTHAPSLGVGAGLTYVPVALSAPGTEIIVDVRGKRRTGRVESKPLYRNDA